MNTYGGLISESLIAETEVSELPDLIGRLAALQARALARIVNAPSLVSTQSDTDEPKLLTVPEAAALVSLSPVALRRSAKFRSARRALGPRSIRFDRAALLKIAGRS